MKGFKSLTSLTLFAGLCGSVSAYAQARETNPPKRRSELQKVNTIPTTANGYNPLEFCREGAEKLMGSLSSPNQGRNEKIAELQAEILSLSQQRQAIAEMNQLSKKYKESLMSLEKISPNDKEKTEKAVDALKGALRNGITLNAVSLLLNELTDEEMKKPESTAFTMSNLCKKEKNTTQEICKKIVEEDKRAEQGVIPRFGQVVADTIGISSEYRKLDKTLASLHGVFQRVKPEDKINLREELKKIIAAIPNDVKPDAILSLLQSKAPTIKGLLEQDVSRESVLACLNEKRPYTEGICMNLAKDKQSRDGLIQMAGVESLATSQSLKKGHLGVVIKSLHDSLHDETKLAADEFSVMQTEKMQALIRDVKSLGNVLKEQIGSSEKNIEESRKPASTEDVTTCSEAKKQLSGTAILFFECPNNYSLSAEDIQKNFRAALQNAENDANTLDNTCQDMNSNPSEESKKKCKELLSKVVVKIDAQKNKYDQKIAELQLQMKALSSNSEHNALERLKEYTVNRYLNSCSVDKSKVETTNVSLSVCNGGEQTDLNLVRLNGLFKDTDAIVQNIRPNGFEFGDLQEYQNTCSSLSQKDEALKNATKDVCDIIASDMKKKQDAVKKEKVYNDPNYYYDYDSKSGNVVKTQKKSAMRVFGEGILPVAPSLIPMWFNNFQTKQNINMLTAQGIYQKQMLYNYEIYNQNPWMYNYGYFGYGNPFSTFGSSTTTTGTSTGFSF